MKAIRIAAVPVQEMHRHPAIWPDEIPTDLKSLQTLVGGPIQIHPTYPGRDDVEVLFAEDGKQRRLPFNEPATDLLAPVLNAGDYIAGDCYLIGPGGESDCPLSIIEVISRLAHKDVTYLLTCSKPGAASPGTGDWVAYRDNAQDALDFAPHVLHSAAENSTVYLIAVSPKGSSVLDQWTKAPVIA